MIRALLFALLWALPAAAQDLSALARLDPARSSLGDDGEGVALRLTISQPVPWRVRVLDDPPRLVMDFREVDWRGLPQVSETAKAVEGLRAGVFRPGWSRLVLDLDGPYAVTEAEMATGSPTEVRVHLEPTSSQAFAAAAAVPEPPGWALPVPAPLLPVQPQGVGPMVVVIDPGHGGIDPGAERDGKTEADLMLTFARELKEMLLRDGRVKVVMTREADEFVPLETRISIAHAAGAQVFLSLHADAIAEGEAVGATVYTLSDEASDKASQTLAERHNRDDLLAGLDLSGQDDQVAQVLMDMARAETTPRTERLANALVSAIKGAGLRMHRHPHQEAGFAVLKSADIPSLLLEVGFLSSQSDLERLSDPAWRARLQGAILQGLQDWQAVETAAREAGAP